VWLSDTIDLRGGNMALRRLVNPGAIVVGLVCVMLICGLKCTQAQTPDDSQEKKLLTCWTSESTKESTGKCPSQVKDQAMLCFNESMAGGIGGNYNTTHMSMLHVDKIAPADLVNCNPAADDTRMVFYDVAVSKSKNTLSLTETHHKCGPGNCAEIDKTTLKGKLEFDGETLVFTQSDGGKLRFSKYQAPDTKETPK
jgi:hypothetical protein